jgi:hypothetical protein
MSSSKSSKRKTLPKSLEEMTYKELRTELSLNKIPNKNYSKADMIEVLKEKDKKRNTDSHKDTIFIKNNKKKSRNANTTELNISNLLTEEEESKLFPSYIEINNLEMDMEDLDITDNDNILVSIEKIFDKDYRTNDEIKVGEVLQILMVMNSIDKKIMDTRFLMNRINDFGTQLLSFIDCETVGTITSDDVINTGLKILFLNSYLEQSIFVKNKNIRQTSLSIGSMVYETSGFVEKTQEKEELTSLLNDNIFYNYLLLSSKKSLSDQLTFLQENHFPKIFLHPVCLFSKEGKLALLSILDALAIKILSTANMMNTFYSKNKNILTKQDYLKAFEEDKYLSIFFNVF